MEGTIPVSNRVRTIERFIEKFYEKESKKILPEQAKEIIRFDLQNSGNDYSVMTRKNYISILRDLALAIRKPFAEMTEQDLGTFLKVINSKYSANTAQQKKIQIKRFFKFVYGTDEYPKVVKWISTKKISRHAEPKNKILSIKEKKALLDSCNNQRDRAIITFLDHTGCRAEELANTRLKDIVPDEKGRFLTINLGKGKTGRRRIIITEGISDINLWINIHPLRSDPDASFLISFSRRNNLKPMQPRSLNSLLENLAEKAGIKRNIYPHLFRHTRVWICKKMKGWNEDQMRLFFGWVQGSKMPSYYGHLSGDDVNDLILQEAGIKTQKEIGEMDIKDRECPRCHSKNPFDAKFCNVCSLALDSKIAENHNKIIKASDEIMDISQENNMAIEKAVEKYVEKIKMKIIDELKAGKGNFLSTATG
jgi:integrase